MFAQIGNTFCKTPYYLLIGNSFSFFESSREIPTKLNNKMSTKMSIFVEVLNVKFISK